MKTHTQVSTVTEGMPQKAGVMHCGPIDEGELNRTVSASRRWCWGGCFYERTPSASSWVLLNTLVQRTVPDTVNNEVHDKRMETSALKKMALHCQYKQLHRQAGNNW